MNVFCVRGLICRLLPALLIIISCSGGQSLQPAAKKPPVAEARPVVDDYFGTKITDPYRWMEEGPTDPKFLEFLQAQNEYTHAAVAPLAAPRGRLLARSKELDNALPVVGVHTRAGEYIFFLHPHP